MLFNLKGLVSALLSYTVFDSYVQSPEDPETWAQVRGIDVSSNQTNINWNNVAHSGIYYAYVQATDGYNWTNSEYNSQYSGSRKAGLIRGAYHYARPDQSSGSDQAEYFMSNGGDWSGDGWTLPGAVWFDYNPDSHDHCYGFNQYDMIQWIREYTDTYYSRYNRYPVCYINYQWWQECTGNYDGYGYCPLWVYHWGSNTGSLPHGWRGWTFWQYSSHGSYPGHGDNYNGNRQDLKRFATG